MYNVSQNSLFCLFLSISFSLLKILWIEATAYMTGHCRKQKHTEFGAYPVRDFINTAMENQHIIHSFFFLWWNSNTSPTLAPSDKQSANKLDYHMLIILRPGLVILCHAKSSRPHKNIQLLVQISVWRRLLFCQCYSIVTLNML